MNTATADDCFFSSEFNAYWDEVYSHTFAFDYTIIPDDGWMLDIILHGFEQDHLAADVAGKVIQAIKEDWEDFPNVYD